jgi:hypothetical protein
MPIDKIFISHVVSEIIIIVGVSFYYHKKCSYLQSQIQELNNKLEKLNVNNYLSLIERQKHFEQQTVQHINKIYSMLNSRNISPQEQQNMYNNQFGSFPTTERFSNSQKYENMTFETENFSLDKDTVQTNSKVEKKAAPQQSQNPFLNTLSMIGPLSTMFQVVMDKKPPHPDELFKNIDNVNGTKKIVEIEDEQIDTVTLDKELEDELNDLKSGTVTAMNTPVLVPRTPKHFSNDSSILTPDKCENGMCKIDYTQVSQSTDTNINNQDMIDSTDLIVSKTETQNDLQNSSQSSPLRYISQIPEQKRGRPKKN